MSESNSGDQLPHAQPPLEQLAQVRPPRADPLPGQSEEAQQPRARRRRRAVRPASAGVDPTPSDHTLNSRAREDLPDGWGDQSSGTRSSGARRSVMRGSDKGTGTRGSGVGRGGSAKEAAARGENDERLKRDRPPHWG